MTMNYIRLLLLELGTESCTIVNEPYIGTLAHTFCKQCDMASYQLIGFGIDMQDFHGLSV